MSNLLVNTRDQQFVLFEQLGVENLLKCDAYSSFSKDDLMMVLKEAEKMAVNVVAPTMAEGDREGCTLKDGVVSVPRCFHEPFKKFIEGGWHCPSASPKVGGQGLPASVTFAIVELNGAANHCFYMYANLTLGAANLLEVFGTEEQKNKYMYKLFSGEWGGTMCLTEPSAGSDVGALKTMAKRLPDGKYLITGTKCFISSGDHNLVPNIVHPVLARIEGDPAGTKGISIFIVPKYRVNEDGSLGEVNDVVTGGIEHKMGIKASATATLNFGENGQCIGELLGNEREGMKIMFQMMNEARLSVGLQGLEAASAVYERSVVYARERVQGNDILAGKDPNVEPVTIIHHPDIRRKLMWMKAHVEGLRAMCYFIAFCMDQAKTSRNDEEKKKWNGYVDLLIPVVKSYSTDKALLICSMAMDIFGGYGYCSEYPIEQYLRDVKIGAIYEGTNGIQAIDLIGRKLKQRNGQNLKNLFDDISSGVARAKVRADLVKAATILEEATDACFDLVNFLIQASKEDIVTAYLNASSFLELFGDVVVGHFLLEAARIATEKLHVIYKAVEADTVKKQNSLCREDKEAAFYSGKVAACRFFAANILTSVKARCEGIKLRDKSAMDIPEEAFSF